MYADQNVGILWTRRAKWEARPQKRPKTRTRFRCADPSHRRAILHQSPVHDQFQPFVVGFWVRFVILAKNVWAYGKEKHWTVGKEKHWTVAKFATVARYTKRKPGWRGYYIQSWRFNSLPRGAKIRLLVKCGHLARNCFFSKALSYLMIFREYLHYYHQICILPPQSF